MNSAQGGAMTGPISRGRVSSVLALVFALHIAGANAQQKEFVQAQRANANALRDYTWKSRTELKLKGESRNVRLEQVRYDIDRQLQKTPIGGGPAESQDSRGGRGRAGGPVRQRAIAKKQEEFEELMNNLAALVGSYAHLPPDRLQAFVNRAGISSGEGLETGSLRIQGRDVLRPGDQMIIWIDPVSSMMRRVEIATALEGELVHVVSDYRSLENGLTYQARSVLRYPEKQLDLTVENFEHTFVGRAR
jgi:hypothetical protein